MEEKSIDEKLFTVKNKCDEKSHLIADLAKCINCKDKVCLTVCPANVYSWNDKDNILEIAFENCLECGACRIACEKRAIEWHYPQSGCGITYKHG